MSGVIVKMRFGSHVYGTNVPESDHDFKSIYLPEAKDILLQRVKGTLKRNTKNDETVKNSKDDVDLEVFSLDRYVQLLLQGQTVALDMLFTPHTFYLEQSLNPVWEELKKNKDKFLHSGITSFVGYCRTQANKYGIKGSRMQAVETSLQWLETLDPESKLFETGNDWIRQLTCEAGEFCNIVYVNDKEGIETPYLEVVGRKFGFTVKIKEIHKILLRIWQEYGHRAIKAKNNEGIDWKALMHAVRVREEARELLLTGTITFPRPESDLLLRIRKGELSYQKVAELIEIGIEEIEKIQAVSTLPKEPDFEFAENFVANAYANVVRQGYEKSSN